MKKNYVDETDIRIKDNVCYIEKTVVVYYIALNVITVSKAFETALIVGNDRALFSSERIVSGGAGNCGGDSRYCVWNSFYGSDINVARNNKNYKLHNGNIRHTNFKPRNIILFYFLLIMLSKHGSVIL